MHMYLLPKFCIFLCAGALFNFCSRSLRHFLITSPRSDLNDSVPMSLWLLHLLACTSYLVSWANSSSVAMNFSDFLIMAFGLTLVRESAFFVMIVFLVSLSYFIIAVPVCKFLGKHWCPSSFFPITILNGIFSLGVIFIVVRDCY